MDIGKTIRLLREERGWTQSELAQKLELTQQAITTYERGTREPTIKTIQLLAHLFEVSVDTLFGKNGEVTRIQHPSKPRIAHNRRSAQVQPLFEKLVPEDQRAVLKQIKLLAGQK